MVRGVISEILRFCFRVVTTTAEQLKILHFVSITIDMVNGCTCFAALTAHSFVSGNRFWLSLKLVLDVLGPDSLRP